MYVFPKLFFFHFQVCLFKRKQERKQFGKKTKPSNIFPQLEENFKVKLWKQRNPHTFIETMKATAAHLEAREWSIKQIWLRRFFE